MLTFEAVTLETKVVVEEMFSSYKLPAQEVGYCVKADDTYIGIIDYAMQEEKALLHFLLVHHDYQGYGYGTNVYYTFEDMMKKEGIRVIEVARKELTERAQSFLGNFDFTEQNDVYIKQI